MYFVHTNIIIAAISTLLHSNSTLFQNQKMVNFLPVFSENVPHVWHHSWVHYFSALDFLETPEQPKGTRTYFRPHFYLSRPHLRSLKWLFRGPNGVSIRLLEDTISVALQEPRQYHILPKILVIAAFEIAIRDI